MAIMGYAYLVHSSIYEEDGAYPILNDILHRLRRDGEAFDATMLLVGTWDKDSESPHVEILEEPDHSLSAAAFFETIASKVTERSPIHEHRLVRTRRGDSLAALLPADLSDDALLNEDAEKDKDEE
ncbi:hypothetical protein AD006_30295 (plasmid) [Pseudonocardia sp. EC080610-09]|nr:hypothetical protein AD006_30295 [Pseudonocardia sp. EC080610-09]ALL85525.1 hypothetical protein AD017_30955 [Pseudonocardia sp. EC080619-01]